MTNTNKPQQDTLSASRALSRQGVLTAILTHAPISRAELARITGLSKQTISQLVGELEADGVLRECGRTQGSLGRSAITYEFDGSKSLVLGIDVGGTKIQAGLADLDGKLIAEEKDRIDPRGGVHVMTQLAGMADRLRSQTRRPVKTCGIGIPGAVDPRTRSVSMMANIGAFDGPDLASAVEEAIGCDVVLDNDVNMAARGELWRGTTDATDFAFVAMGTGIGLGLVCDGRIVRGRAGMAGEIAHLPVGGDPYDSRNLATGPLEDAVGSAGILARYKAAGGKDAKSVRDVFAAVGRGDPIALRTIDEIARIVALAVTAISAVAAPQAFIFGGGVGARPELVERITAHLNACMQEPVPCEISTLGSSAALFGAFAAAKDQALRMLLPPGMEQAIGWRLE